MPPAVVYEYKGIFPRFFAKVLDGFFLLIPLGLLMLIVSLLTGYPSGKDSLAPMLLSLLSVIFVIVYIALEGGGGTPGKRVLGMRIVDAGGKNPGFGKALVRNLLGIVDFLPFAYILGVVMVASSPNKQRLGDRVAGTYIVGKE
ncbi:MAG: RDD family protein [Anaerolineae bacterium]